MDPELKAKLEAKAKWVRQKVVDMAVNAKSGHVSTAFSQTELLVTLYYGGILRYDPRNIKWEGRDRFIFSKGHAAAALYAALAYQNFFPKEILDTYAQPGSRLAEQPSPASIPGVELATGSLGHGLPVGAGMALAGKIQGRPYRVYALMSDGECN